MSVATAYHPHHYRQQRSVGSALIIVLWLLAALALLAAGVGQLVRDQARYSLAHQQLLQGQAAGEVAIYLALLQWQAEGEQPQPSRDTVEVDVDGLPITVEFQPWTGLVNINHAADGLWAALLMGAAGLPQGAANALGQAIVEARQTLRETGPNPPPGPWETIQDLLLVPGMDYSVYAAIAPYVVAHQDGQSGVHAELAPEELQQWLQAGASEQLLSSTDNGKFYTVTAWVPTNSPAVVKVQRDLLWQSQDLSGLPWTLLASRASLQPMGHTP